MKKLICLLAIVTALCLPVFTQAPIDVSPEALQKYVPLLPSVKEQVWKIDPKLGYAVHEVGGGVYVISDNGWQSAFLVTGDGVIVFDAPASFGKSIPSAIAKVTNQPIKMLDLLARAQGSHWRVGGLQEHSRPPDRRARNRR